MALRGGSFFNQMWYTQHSYNKQDNILRGSRYCGISPFALGSYGVYSSIMTALQKNYPLLAILREPFLLTLPWVFPTVCPSLDLTCPLCTKGVNPLIHDLE